MQLLTLNCYDDKHNGITNCPRGKLSRIITYVDVIWDYRKKYYDLIEAMIQRK